MWLVAPVIAKDQVPVVQLDRLAPESELRRGVLPAQLGLTVKAGPAQWGIIFQHLDPRHVSAQVHLEDLGGQHGHAARRDCSSGWAVSLDSLTLQVVPIG